jgi:hypothetical protein
MQCVLARCAIAARLATTTTQTAMRLRPHNPPCKATRAAFGAGAAVMALTRRVDWYALFNGLRKPTHT